MGDGLKLSKDKRHRSSSSIAGAGLESTRSERKLEIRGLIPEVDDHFALAESRCDDLQEKIDMVKVLKRKKKLNKRSMTRVTEQPTVTENMPFITVRTQPKKKVSQQASRLRRLEVPQNPTRGYLDPATVEQHRMLGQVWGYGQNFNREDTEYPPEQRSYPKPRPRRNRADGDGMCGHGVDSGNGPAEVACGQNDDIGFSDTQLYDQDAVEYDETYDSSKQMNNRTQKKAWNARKRDNYSRDNNLKEVPKWIDSSIENIQVPRGKVHSPGNRYRQNQQQQSNAAPKQLKAEERPVVELFNNSRPQIRAVYPAMTRPVSKREDNRTKKLREVQKFEEQSKGQSEFVLPAESKKEHHPRRVKYRSRGYEMPTVASQMKQADIRYHSGIVNRTNIPFVVSKSTAPSHNIGVNIQQVLNGLKIQQPLNGIPLTIAHHMGLGHVATYGVKSVSTQPSLDNREINAIKLGRRLLLLPSYKSMSYNRLLTLYREGDGMVPRFLRAISRPNYFYTSMYNLTTNREDLDNATSKGRAASLETKQHLTEYASLYREYEQVDRKVKEGGHTADLERRREDLLRELASREDHIRKLVQDSSMGGQGEFNVSNLRATASSADDGHRHSFKHNAGDLSQ